MNTELKNSKSWKYCTPPAIEKINTESASLIGLGFLITWEGKIFGKP
jgi:hypothetical protein